MIYLVIRSYIWLCGNNVGMNDARVFSCSPIIGELMAGITIFSGLAGLQVFGVELFYMV